MSSGSTIRAVLDSGSEDAGRRLVGVSSGGVLAATATGQAGVSVTSNLSGPNDLVDIRVVNEGDIEPDDLFASEADGIRIETLLDAALPTASKNIIFTNAVGGIRPTLRPGAIADLDRAARGDTRRTRSGARGQSLRSSRWP